MHCPAKLDFFSILAHCVTYYALHTFGSDLSSTESSKLFNMGLLNKDRAEVVPSWKLCLLTTAAVDVVGVDDSNKSFFIFFWCVFLGNEALECFINWGLGSTEGGQLEKEVFNPPAGLGGKGGGCVLSVLEVPAAVHAPPDCWVLTRLTTVACPMLTCCWDLGWVIGGLLSNCWTGPNCFSYTLWGLSLEWLPPAPLRCPILP